MERILPAKVHNKFEIEVTDAATGKLKQSVTCYNIILNSFFSRLVSRASKLGYIFLGTGTGTPVITRTSLFNTFCYISATTVETVKAYPTSYVRKKIVLSPSQYVGSRITEVGFGYTNSSGALVTHSMLKDSEGNQIAITKTDADVLTVYATFYCTINPAVDGSYVLPSVNNNAIIPAIISDSYSFDYMYLGAEQNMATSDDLRNGSIVSRSLSVAADTTNYRWNFTATRLNYDEGGKHMFSSVGIPNIAAWKLPNSDIFPYVPLRNIPVGTGDGETTDFDLPIPLFQEDSESIRVDGVTMERGVDYTVNHRNNNAEYGELCDCCDPTKVSISGGYAAGTSYVKSPIICWGRSEADRRRGIRSGNPFILDFSSARPFNRIVVPKGCFSANYSTYGGYYSGELKFEHSLDGETWTTAATLANTTIGDLVGDFTFANPITARYWRISSGNSTGMGGSFFPNIQIFYHDPGLKFTNPPADGAAIEMDCTLDRPIKNENWVLDFSCSVEFSRG